MLNIGINQTSPSSSDAVSETTSSTSTVNSASESFEYNLVTDWTSVTSPNWSTVQQHTLPQPRTDAPKTMIPAIVVPGADKQPGENNHNNSSPFVLSVIRQPEEQHRARYLSEGSRGAIKDRSGTSNCTVQLTGFYRPTRVELFATTGSGPATPHTLYRLIPVSGKSANTTPCRKSVSHDGIDCLEITLRPESNMTALLDCIGILKICSYDTKQRKRYHGTAGGQHSAVRIAFRAYIPHDNQPNAYTIIETQSEPIRCVQQLGVPEVLKMSLQSSPARGGDDLFIIGRNFDRNTVVVFREYKDDGTLAWNAEAVIDKQLLHQCHIVCAIPTYCDLYRGGNVSVTVKCGQKSSHPINFVYTPSSRCNQSKPPCARSRFGLGLARLFH
uniref:RHD domain-containing protein n=1 Tax=Panagrellus redivivus TaxID=6233 RepID=A0A7E4ZWN1_PANRE